MTTINLHQNNQQEDKPRFSMKSENSGFIFASGILFVTLLVFAGLKFYTPLAEGKNDELSKSIVVENDKLVGLKDLERIVDMQKRLSEIRSNLQLKNGEVSRSEMTDVLDHLGDDLNKNIVVSDFEYDNGKVSVMFGANNFSDIARQILNFKKSAYFAGVEIVDTTRNDGVVSCSIDMNVK